MGLTFVSWIGFGYFYGWGYCFLTDWHWTLLQEMGYQDLPMSYITFLIDRFTGWKPNDQLVINLTGWVFGFVFLITLFLGVKDHKKTKVNQNEM